MSTSSRTITEYLAAHGDSAALLDRVRDALAAIGPTTEQVTKSQIAFVRDTTVVVAWTPGQYLGRRGAPLVLTFDFPQRVPSPRWKDVVDVHARHVAHHLELHEPGDVDEQVMAWLRSAYASAGSSRARPRAGTARVPGPSTLSEEDRRVLAAWAADCAARVLPIFHAAAPHDTRARDAVSAARSFARGDLRIAVARAVSARAHAAARDVEDPAARAAARAAGHAAAVAHMASHALGAPGYAALAVVAARPGDPHAADASCRWAIEHASPEVRSVLRRLPPRPPSRGALGSLVHALHVALTQ